MQLLHVNREEPIWLSSSWPWSSHSSMPSFVCFFPHSISMKTDRNFASEKTKSTHYYLRVFSCEQEVATNITHTHTHKPHGWIWSIKICDVNNKWNVSACINPQHAADWCCSFIRFIHSFFIFFAAFLVSIFAPLLIAVPPHPMPST